MFILLLHKSTDRMGDLEVHRLTNAGRWHSKGEKQTSPPMSKQRQGKRYMHFSLCFCILSQLYVYGKCIYLSNALQIAVCVWYG